MEFGGETYVEHRRMFALSVHDSSRFTLVGAMTQSDPGERPTHRQRTRRLLVERSLARVGSEAAAHPDWGGGGATRAHASMWLVSCVDDVVGRDESGRVLPGGTPRSV